MASFYLYRRRRFAVILIVVAVIVIDVGRDIDYEVVGVIVSGLRCRTLNVASMWTEAAGMADDASTISKLSDTARVADCPSSTTRAAIWRMGSPLLIARLTLLLGYSVAPTMGLPALSRSRAAAFRRRTPPPPSCSTHLLS